MSAVADQQVGRSGRALRNAPVVLVPGTEDCDIQDYFIGSAFPSRAKAEEAIALLERTFGPVAESEILSAVNVGKMRLRDMRKILEVEGDRAGLRWRVRRLPQLVGDPRGVGVIGSLAVGKPGQIWDKRAE